MMSNPFHTSDPVRTMHRTRRCSVAVTVAFAAALSASPTSAQRTQAGPVIEPAGAVFPVPSPTFATPADQQYRVAFDVAAAASAPDRLNTSFNTVARFLNMHAQAGVPRENVGAAVVVHGAAAFELLDDAAYREKFGTANPNAALLRALIEAEVPVVLCGQSAASRGIPTDRLVDGVQVALSAMTAHLVLQEQGFRVNPW